MRIDKLLWYLRLAGSRTIAQAMAEEGHIRLNGRRVDRAHLKVSAGDVLVVPLGLRVRVIELLALPARRGPAPEAREEPGADDDDPRLAPPAPGAGEATGGGRGVRWGWADAVHYVKSHGHPGADDYTPEALALYTEAISRAARPERRARVMDANAAQAGGDYLKKYLRTLD